MTRRLLAAIAALAIAAAAASSPARASSDVQVTLPGYPANSLALDELVGLGLGFWHARGVRPCAPDVLVTPGLSRLYNAAAAAIPARCQLLLDPADARDLEPTTETAPPVYDRHGAPLTPRARDAYLCAVVFHELGHLAGLEHTAGAGLMSGRGGTWIVTPSAPWACRAWARERAQARTVIAELRRHLHRPHRQPRAKPGTAFDNRG